MTRPAIPAPNETEAQRLARLDREAIRSYSDKRYAGGIVSKRYYQHKDDERSTPAPAQNKKK